MFEKKRVQVEETMEDVVEDIKRTRLRTLQGDTFKCAAQCCADTTAPSDQTNRCFQECSVKFEEAQFYFKKEIQNLQSRLQRCIMQCNDDVNDNLGANPTKAEIVKYNAEYESCGVACMDKHLRIIPTFVKKMKEVLAKGNIPSMNPE